MTVNSFPFVDILKGKRIKLTLKTSSYFGVVRRINPNKTVLLADVASVENGRKFPGVKLFFGHEIVNVEFSGETKSDSGKKPDHKVEDHLTIQEFQPYKKSIILDDDENDEEYIDFVVIDEFHEKFGPAVMHIKKQQVIGVGADGVGVFQHGRLCWLQIATRNKVYLFDILLLGAKAFKNGLSMILENQYILKVLHDCRGIAGCLIAQFGIRLTNIFDTQVADVMCFYSETGGFLPDRVSTLQEVVSFHLKVPSSRLSSLQVKSQLSKEEREMWYMRPCPMPLLKVMALSVIHLQPLRLVLLDTLMTDYMGLVDSYLNSSHKEPDDMEHISMSSVLELPRELRELERMRQERQEWAMHRYPVTEQGLLVRGKPRHQPQTSHPAEEQSPVPQDLSDLRKQLSLNSPVSQAAGLGLTELVMDTMGRGRLSEKDQQPSFPAFPCIGRGFSLQIPPAQVVSGDMKTPGRMAMAPPGLSSNIPGLGGGSFIPTPQALPSPLSQSFSSFRKT